MFMILSFVDQDENFSYKVNIFLCLRCEDYY